MWDRFCLPQTVSRDAHAQGNTRDDDSLIDTDRMQSKSSSISYKPSHNHTINPLLEHARTLNQPITPSFAPSPFLHTITPLHMCVNGSMRCIVGGKRRMETVTLPVRLVPSLSQHVSQGTLALATPKTTIHPPTALSSSLFLSLSQPPTLLAPFGVCICSAA